MGDCAKTGDDLYTALIVLTAGRSSRMGEPKALLRFGKWTALELAVENAITAEVNRVVAVVGHRAEEIRAAHIFTGLPLKFEWVGNLESDSPMLVSLQTALRSLAAVQLDAFFFQPIDVPLLRANDFRELTAAFRARQPGESVFIAAHGNQGGHPVLCDARLIPEFLQVPRDGTARDVIGGQKRVYVDTGNPGVIEDMDTRDDYRRLRQLYEAREVGQSPMQLDRFSGGFRSETYGTRREQE